MRMEWSDGTKATLTPTDRVGELGFGLGLRAIQAERALARSQAEVRRLQRELLRGEDLAERWEQIASSLRQSSEIVPKGIIGAKIIREVARTSDRLGRGMGGQG